MAYSAIAFDIDGTLYPDAGLHRLLLPFALRHGPFLLAFSRARSILHREALAQGEGPKDLESFRLRQASLIGRYLGIKPARALALADKLVYTELEARFREVELYPGTRACLEALKAAGLPMAALSDFPAQAKIAHLGLADLLPLALTSEACGRLKPAPLPFLDLARRLGKAPESILYVGNSVRYDVAGAKAAGMAVALRIDRGGPARSGPPSLMRGADFVFSAWKDLAGFVLP